MISLVQASESSAVMIVKEAVSDDPQEVGEEAEADQVRKKKKKDPLGWFGKLLSVWVLLAMIVGALLGVYLPDVSATVASWQYAQIWLPSVLRLDHGLPYDAPNRLEDAQEPLARAAGHHSDNGDELGGPALRYVWPRRSLLQLRHRWSHSRRPSTSVYHWRRITRRFALHCNGVRLVAACRR